MQDCSLSRRGVFALGTAAVVAGCAGGGGSAESPEAAGGGMSAPEDLEEHFAREAPRIEKQPIRGGEAWSAYLEAKEPPEVVARKGFLQVTADLGWDEEVICFVYEEPIDAGSTSTVFIEEASKSVDFRWLAPYYLDHIGLEPVLAIRGIYHVERDGVRAAGDYKVGIVPRSEYPVVCIHDAPGYAESFARVTREFAESFEFESEMAEAIRGELWIAALGGQPVGFAKRDVYALKDGGVRSVFLSALFLPTSPGELSSADEVSVLTFDKQGNWRSGKYLDFENGELVLEMDVENAKNGYEYSGTIQDKKVEGHFAAKGVVAGLYALELRLKKLARGSKKAKFVQYEYTPSLDPSKATKVSYVVRPDGDRLHVEATVGKRSIVMYADSSGVVRELRFQVGPSAVELSLMEEEGAL